MAATTNSVAGRRHRRPTSCATMPATWARLMAVVAACTVTYGTHMTMAPSALQSSVVTASPVPRRGVYESPFLAVNLSDAPGAEGLVMLSPAPGASLSGDSVRILGRLSTLPQHRWVVDRVAGRRKSRGAETSESSATAPTNPSEATHSSHAGDASTDTPSGLAVCFRVHDELSAHTRETACRDLLQSDEAFQAGTAAHSAGLDPVVADDGVQEAGDVWFSARVGAPPGPPVPRGRWSVQAYLLDRDAAIAGGARDGVAEDDKAFLPGELLAVSPVVQFVAVDASSCTWSACADPLTPTAAQRTTAARSLGAVNKATRIADTCSADAFSVYLYPLPDAGASEGDAPQPLGSLDAAVRMSDEYRQFYNAVAASPHRTNDPAAACVLIPPIDTTCLRNNCHPPAMTAALARLPHWNGGRRHVLLQLSDRRMVGDLDVGFAAFAESSVSADVIDDVETTAAVGDTAASADTDGDGNNGGDGTVGRGLHRVGYDVGFPLAFYRCRSPPFAHLERFTSRAGTTFDSAPAFASRKYLLSFKGARYNVSRLYPHARARSWIASMHNGRDIVIALYCTWTAPACKTGIEKDFFGAADDECAPQAEIAGRYDYDQLLLESQFALVTGGEGTHSYRLLEALGAGAVPVVMGRGAVDALPFRDIVKWQRIAVLIDDDAPQDLAATLRGISMRQRTTAHIDGRRIFELILRRLQSHVDTMLLTIHRHMFDPSFAEALHADAMRADHVDSRAGRPGVSDRLYEASQQASGSSSSSSSSSGGGGRGDTGDGDDGERGEHFQRGRAFEEMVPCGDALLYWCWPGSPFSPVVRDRAQAEATAIGRRVQAHLEAGEWDAAIHTGRQAVLAIGGPSEGLLQNAADATVALLSLAHAYNMSGRPASALHASRMAVVCTGWEYHFDGDTRLQPRGVPMRVVTAIHSSIVKRYRDTTGFDVQKPGPLPTTRMSDCMLPVGDAHAAPSGDGAARGSQEASPARPSIAIVTLCDYSAEQTMLTALSVSNKLRYARRHGYTLFVETESVDGGRAPAWSKVLLLRKHLRAADWVMWMDCDSFFMAPDVRLEQFLPEEDQCVSRTANSSTGGDNDGGSADRINVILSEDGVMVNTGVFLLRNCEWSLDLLHRTYGADGAGNIAPSPFQAHPWWEQAAMLAALSPLLPPGGGATAEPSVHDMLPSEARASAALVNAAILGRHTLSLPQKWLNAYPAEVASKFTGGGAPLHAVYEPGDFIVSFSGCRVVVGTEQCERLIAGLFDAADAAQDAG